MKVWKLILVPENDEESQTQARQNRWLMCIVAIAALGYLSAFAIAIVRLYVL